MDEFDEVKFSAQLASDPQLLALRESLQEELDFFAEPQVQFDPITILTIISIAIQLIIYCRERRNPEAIAADIKTLKTLPTRKLLRLRRRLNVLWRECGGEDATSRRLPNPIMTAVLELSEKLDDAQILALFKFSELVERG